MYYTGSSFFFFNQIGVFKYRKDNRKGNTVTTYSSFD